MRFHSAAFIAAWLLAAVLTASAQAPATALSLSPRAQQLEDIFNSCAKNRQFADCPGWTEVRNRCMDRVHWPEADCAAFREQTSIAKALKLRYEFSLAKRKEQCAEGDQEACHLFACPANLANFGTDAEVIACAKARKQRYTKVWILTEENLRGTQGAYEFLCLKRVEEISEWGEHIPTRITLLLFPLKDPITGAPKPGYYDPPTGTTNYPTAEAAATAVCPKRIEKLLAENAARGTRR